MATIRITSINYNNQSANITFYSENNPDVPINLGLNVIPYARTGSDVFGRYVLSFPAFGSVCEASIFSPTPTTTTSTSTTGTTTTGTTTTGGPTTTPSPSNFIASYYPDFDMSINFGTSSNGLVDFGDGDARVFSNNTTLTKNSTGWTVRENSRSWNGVASSDDGIKLVAVVDGGQIYTSTDSGVSWTARESNRAWYSVCSSADGTKLAAVVYNGQIYTSTNSGVTWTARESNRLWRSIASSSDGTKLVAVVYSDGQIYTSTDSGVTWTARESNRFWRSVASSSDGTKLVAAVDGGQIYTSTDSGVSWTARESNRAWYSVCSSADGTKLAAVVSNGQIYTSSDSGVSWTARESNQLWISIASNSDGTKLVAVSTGKIYSSANSGVSWTARENNRFWRSVASSSDGTKLVAVVYGGQIYTSRDNILTVSPSYNRITFTNNSSSNQRNLGLYSVSSWGNLTNINNMFINNFNNILYGTDSLSYIPDNWNGITSAIGAFRGCNSLYNITINSTSLNNLNGCFVNTSINSLSLDTPNLIDSASMLANSNIKTFSIIDSSSIASMNNMFDGCSNLDGDFTGFSLAGLSDNNLDTFMRGVTLSRANYNKTLVYWDANKASYPFNNFIIHMGNSKADSSSGGVNGIIAKLNLVTHGWTITDADGTVGPT